METTENKHNSDVKYAKLLLRMSAMKIAAQNRLGKAEIDAHVLIKQYGSWMAAMKYVKDLTVQYENLMTSLDEESYEAEQFHYYHDILYYLTRYMPIDDFINQK